MQALLLVDLQNDFLPGGALAVPGGDEVIAVANRLMPGYPFVVASQDWHPPDHLSFASQHPGKQVGETVEVDGLEQILWPDHCVQHTRGADFCARLDLDRIHEVVRKGADRRIDSYSAFFDNGHRKQTALADVLNARGVDEVHIMGLATDVCVKFTALDARKLGLRATVVLSGCRAVNLSPGDGDAAVETMADSGVTIVKDGAQSA